MDSHGHFQEKVAKEKLAKGGDKAKVSITKLLKYFQIIF